MRKPPGQRAVWSPTPPAITPSVTRPAEPWQHTRPADGGQNTRPADGFLPTRPTPLPVASRTAVGSAVRQGTPAAAPAPPRRPAAAPVAPPNAEGHWQLSGAPGANLVLMPGQMHMGHQVASLRTLLGSCVAITLWHPQRRIGGMCHFLLPNRQRRPGEEPDGRYGDEAVDAMVKALTALRTKPEEYVAHLYGGADTMSGTSNAKFNIGERNIEQGWSLIDRFGFQLDGVDVGEDVPRMVTLALGSGQVNMRRGHGHAPDFLRA
jgi:chemotaxis protein CheD